MKTSISKILFALLLTAGFGKSFSQSDLLAVNTVNTPSSVSNLIKSDDKVVISDFKRIVESGANTPSVTVRCETPVTMKIRIFTLNGELAKEEAHALDNGLNDLSLDMADLSQGVYMVQFYSSEGSALRRFVKSN